MNFLQYFFLNLKRLDLNKKMPIKKIKIIFIILVISILALFIINGSNFKAAFTFYDIDIVSYLKDNSSSKISKILLGVTVAKIWGKIAQLAQKIIINQKIILNLPKITKRTNLKSIILVFLFR